MEKGSRALKYVQINSFYNGSTGTIMLNLHKELLSQGVDSYVFWGRRHKTLSDRECCIASPAGVALHGGRVRLTDRMGFYSRRDTARLLRRLDEIDPDIVHLHNIHGYYINVEMLFCWLKSHKCKVRWTLHDCWPFTGHCAYFTYVGCNQWRTECGKRQKCPQLDTYPSTLNTSNCVKNYRDKKRIFTSIPTERMTLITPSKWLKDLVEKSFLGAYPVEVIHNTVDTTVFNPSPSDFRSKYGIEGRFMILGVASPWTERKGLSQFIRLWEEIDSKSFAVVIVGLSKKQIEALPDGLLGLPRTSSAEELAKIYSAADVFFNPTLEDNFPTVNLEAEACGVPVVTYDTGGCSETIVLERSVVVNGFDEAVEAIQNLMLEK